MPPSTKLAVVCDDNGRREELVLTLQELEAPLSQLRFYLSGNDTEPVSVASYIEGVQAAPNTKYSVYLSDDKKSAHLLMDADQFKGQQYFKHYAIFSTQDHKTGITLEADKPHWSEKHVCPRPSSNKSTSTSTSLLPDVSKHLPSRHAFSKRMGLIIGLSAGTGGLLVMLLCLMVCCCMRKRNRRKNSAAERKYYEQTYRADRDYDEFEYRAKTTPPPPVKKESATSSYLRKYYARLKAVKEEHDADSDGEAQPVLEETIV